ncbi:cupin domain-containing protein [Methylobacter sp. YRD-M1]|uniref:cupin domain-containing protein n=1 Tax=Methylobacter sp. YRD-M1 TaxID=2911520 RepID=UPI00227A450D|nr:cupin domain-containing protein [Methylobacter sp. YRD-M1]WAK01015.1 cupin domain-containing protein [Methylobacter sp. YRD-M1]
MKKLSMMIMSFTALAPISQLGYSTKISPAKIPEATRTIIQRTDIEGSDEELRLMLVEYPPGYASPAHIHPVVGLNYILEGTAESQYEGEDLKTLNAGDSYQDPANKKHLVFRNSSNTDRLRFLVAYRIKKDGAFMHPL